MKSTGEMKCSFHKGNARSNRMDHPSIFLGTFLTPHPWVSTTYWPVYKISHHYTQKNVVSYRTLAIVTIPLFSILLNTNSPSESWWLQVCPLPILWSIHLHRALKCISTHDTCSNTTHQLSCCTDLTGFSGPALVHGKFPMQTSG